MEIAALLDLVRRRRSIRRFKPDPLPEGSVEKILEVARWAMSGANGQPWEFVVVKDKELKERIVQIHKDGRKSIRTIEESRISELRHPAFNVPREEPGYKDAPVFIVICADPRTYQATVLGANFYRGDGGPTATFFKNMANATQLIHLAAAALGLGAQWLSVASPWEGRVREVLGIPDVLVVHTIVPIGYPDYKARPPYRRKLDEMVHYDRYDKSKFRTDEQIQEFLADLRRRSIPAYEV